MAFPRIGWLALALICCISCQRPTDESYSFLFHGVPEINKTRAIQIASTDTLGGNNDRFSLQPGETVDIVDQQGSGVLTRLWFTFDSRDPNYLRNLLIKVFYDEAEIPAIFCPIGDFFGCAFQYKHWNSEWMGMTSGGFYSYWPMPFRKNIRISIWNDSEYPLYALYFHANLNMTENNSVFKLPYFHAQWNRQTTLPYTESYEALDVQGAGLFVGLHYNAQGLSGGLGYLEGDESIYIDGHLSMSGTGMEDYLNSGWYFRTGEYSALHHGLILKEDSLARISAYRYHIKDAIPFQNEIKIELEHGHQNESYTDLSTVAFWYEESPEGHRNTLPPLGQRNHFRRILPAKDIHEAEDIYESAGHTAKIIETENLGVDWSQNKYLELTSENNMPINMIIKDLEESEYMAHLYLTHAPDYGRFTVANQQIDLEDHEILPVADIKIPLLKAQDGQLNITFYPEQISAKLGIDIVHLEPIRRYVPEWHFIGPFANPRLSDTERFGLDSIYAPETQPFNGLDTFIGINGQLLQWQTIDGKPGGYGMQLWKYVEPYEFVICYAHTFVLAPEAKTYDLMIGSDDGIKVFLNGEQIHRFLEVRIAAPDQTRIPVQLKKGENSLLLKLENNFGGYAFYTRFIDPGNELKYSLWP